MTLEKGWWNDEVDSVATKYRHGLYGDTLSCVRALGEIGDPRARRSLELAAECFQRINVDDSYLVDECKSALSKLPPAVTLPSN
jgi:hypothetical protein